MAQVGVELVHLPIDGLVKLTREHNDDSEKAGHREPFMPLRGHATGEDQCKHHRQHHDREVNPQRAEAVGDSAGNIFGFDKRKPDFAWAVELAVKLVIDRF
ncbi:hypothetical protein D3C78_1714720 [compost metagenome]